MKYRFHYAGIRVRNLPRALRFYTKALGMKVSGQGTMKHGGKWVQLVGPSQRLELNWYPRGSRFASRHTKVEELDHLAFVVDDAKAAYADLITTVAEAATSWDPAKTTAVSM